MWREDTSTTQNLPETEEMRISRRSIVNTLRDRIRQDEVRRACTRNVIVVT